MDDFSSGLHDFSSVLKALEETEKELLMLKKRDDNRISYLKKQQSKAAAESVSETSNMAVVGAVVAGPRDASTPATETPNTKTAAAGPSDAAAAVMDVDGKKVVARQGAPDPSNLGGTSSAASASADSDNGTDDSNSDNGTDDLAALVSTRSAPVVNPNSRRWTRLPPGTRRGSTSGQELDLARLTKTSSWSGSKRKQEQEQSDTVSNKDPRRGGGGRRNRQTVKKLTRKGKTKRKQKKRKTRKN